MAISIKTPEDIEKMRVAGRLAAEVLEMIEPYVKPGVSTGGWIASVMITLLMNNTRFLPCLGYHGYANPFASQLMKWCATVSRTMLSC